MAKFKTRFSELGFYVDGSLRRFKGGIYTTEDKAEIAALEKLADVSRVDEPTKAEDKAAKSGKADDKPAKKPTAKK